jgi:hypothetical protein
MTVSQDNKTKTDIQPRPKKILDRRVLASNKTKGKEHESRFGLRQQYKY